MRWMGLKHRAGVVLAIMLAAPVASRPAAAAAGSQDGQRGNDSQQGADDARPIEGLWESTVTITDCDTGDPITSFRAMNMFIRGGALSVTDDAAPTTRGPGFGQWHFEGGRRYSDGFRFLQFSPDGTFAGLFTVARNIVLGRSANAFTSRVTGDIFDANGSLVQSVCARETSVRVQ